MKKRELLLTFILCACGSLLADTSQEINQQIDQLQNQIDHYRVDQMNTNTTSQKYMFGQPHEYAEAMKRVEKLDNEINILEQRLKELRAEHDKILREIKPPQQ